MKDLKKKLTAATAMLVVSAVMLSGVSYAWYTLSTNPEVKGMKTTVVANENLEIALEQSKDETVNAVDKRSEFATDVQGSKSGNYYTWGNLVNLDNAFTKLGSALQIRPVKYVTAASEGLAVGDLQFPKYGSDGRVSELGKLNALAVSNTDETNTGGVYGWSESTTSNQDTNYYAYQVNYWLRSNIAGNVVLQTDGAKRANDGTNVTSGVNGESGAGSYIKIKLTAGDADKATKEKAKVDAYLNNFKIRFIANTNEDVVATIDKSSEAVAENGDFYLKYGLKLNSDEKVTALTANNAQLVKMYVYLDGETVSNGDALLETLDNVEINVQFGQSEVDKAMTGTTK